MLGMPDIELQDILKVICEVVGGLQVDRKFHSQTIQMSSAPSCTANTDLESGQIMWIS